ncbi:RNA 2'-phosphotransferase [Kineosporia sp. R_H_3]|uniref:RNA 2'-phosphotransferase n=1 Tax=Kineosporia sp. R_H_3 TaxID=1961848 RepID=UPI000B4B3FE2|nr:RNA 2'-phosphotransferase [Kineosporia sp. R_H_3]
MRDDDVALSRFLAYVLRHRPEAVGLALAEGGWVEVPELLAALAANGRPVDRARLDRLVAGPGKVRFELVDGRVRAAQGHSVPVELGLPPLAPPDVLWHGTAAGSVGAILAEGLVPGRRTQVHLSGDPGTARDVGARHGRPVVLRVDAAGLHASGGVFTCATNGVWLVDRVPARFLSRTDL